MARTYRATPISRVANAVMKTVLRIGFGPPGTVLLTTIGRRSGIRHATPVNVTDHQGERWLVSPYGTRGWVHNVRASGDAELRRGRRSERVRLEQADAATAAPVLREYARANSITRPYFDAAPDAPLEEFEAEAPRHPVFRIAGPASS
jgi:deazaflavin-dependent oxidoreductase (nitroreductase family)